LPVEASQRQVSSAGFELAAAECFWFSHVAVRQPGFSAGRASRGIAGQAGRDAPPRMRYLRRARLHGCRSASVSQAGTGQPASHTIPAEP